MNRTPIEWTDYSSNPLKYRNAAGEVVWGCAKVSAGCTHCYAEAQAHRYRRGGPFNAGVMATLTPFLDDAELHRMLTYKPAAGKRCFVGDMTDVFGEWVPDSLLDRLFAVFALRTDVTWQVLTKRPERMRAYVTGRRGAVIGRAWSMLGNRKLSKFRHHDIKNRSWPLPNVWLGVSAEDQQRADERIPHLLQTPAAVRFISAEPLLGPIDLKHVAAGPLCPQRPEHRVDVLRAGTWRLRTGLTRIVPEFVNHSDMERLDWVIVGGESGAGARPTNSGAICRIVAQCMAFGTPVFLKQFGSNVYSDANPNEIQRQKYSIRTDDDVAEAAAAFSDYLTKVHSLTFKDRKGSDPAEWPEALRVRQFPEARP